MDRPLYLFLHLPKTAGAAFIRNAEKFFPPSHFLRLNCLYRQYYFHPRTKQLCFYENEEDFKRLIGSLTELEKQKIAVIAGHDVPYGIHHEFGRLHRYFMFVRDPIARTISLYNYQRSQVDFLKGIKKIDEAHRRLQLLSEKWFLVEGEIPSFEEWLEKSYNRDYPFYFTMNRALQQFGYLDIHIKADSWNRLLDKFFFIGLTETVDEDELYLYHQMEIGRFWADRNASKPYVFQSQLPKETQEKIREKNRDDLILYEYAKQRNASFKRKEQKFSLIVTQMKKRKKRAFFVEKSALLLKFFMRPFWNFFIKKVKALRTG